MNGIVLVSDIFTAYFTIDALRHGAMLFGSKYVYHHGTKRAKP